MTLRLATSTWLSYSFLTAPSPIHPYKNPRTLCVKQTASDPAAYTSTIPIMGVDLGLASPYGMCLIL